MPKLPRTGGKASTSERATKPAAKRAAAAAPKEGTRTPSKRTTGSAAAKTRTATPKKKPAANGGNGRAKTKAKIAGTDFRHRPVDKHAKPTPAGPETKLTDDQRVLLGDLFAVVEEYADEAVERIDRDLVERAFLFSCERHADQRRASGEDFITHPIGVAKICAGMRLDSATLCAALLHDTVEDTSASLDEVRAEFGDEIAQLVDGVTKLTGITFQSRDEAQAENYRKMMVAMATDIRVILIKLADRLHNMRTLD